VNPVTVVISSVPVGGECRFPCGCLVRVTEQIPSSSILAMGYAKIEYVDLCEMCEARHQVGEFLEFQNTRLDRGQQ
jgi:hypothetical protein